MSRWAWWKAAAWVVALVGASIPGSCWAVDGARGVEQAREAVLESGAVDPIAVARQAVATADGAGARVALGEALLSAGQVEEALAEFDKALELAPRSHRAQIGVARARAAQGDFVGAVAILEEGAKLNPRPEAMYYELGRVHEAAGRFETAVSWYRKALDRLLR